MSNLCTKYSAAALLLALAVPASGQSAMEILKKSQALTNGAKTYQAVILVNNNAGKAGTMTLKMDVKTAGKKSAVSTSVVGQPTGQFAMMGAMASSQMVDDGTNLWIYNPAMKSYFKRPSMGGAAGGASPLKDIARMTKDSTVTLAGSKTVGGKQLHVINITPKAPTPGAPDKVTLFIEKSTYLVKQMQINMKAPGMGGQGSQAITTLIQVQSQKVNQPIAATAFKFTPPAGAKEMQGGGMMGGGPPGGPGAAGRR